MRHSPRPGPAWSLGVGALLLATPALAGDDLGISDAGSTFATALATLGIVMSIAGLAIAGFLMATNFFLALTVGGSLLVGGTIMALSEQGASALWGADLGGGSVVDFAPTVQAAPATVAILALSLTLVLVAVTVAQRRRRAPLPAAATTV